MPNIIASLMPIDRYGYSFTVLMWLCLIPGIFCVWLFISNFQITVFTGDFSTLHGASHAAVHGEFPAAEIYRVDTLTDYMRRLYGERAVSPGGPYLYPPATLMFMSGLGYLSVNSAYILWASLVILSIGLSAWLLGARGLPLVALTINPSTMLLVAFGQTASIPTFAACLALYFLKKQESFGFGALLAAMTLKPQLAVAGPLILVAKRDQVAALGYVINLALLFVISGLFFGFISWAAFGNAIYEFSKTLGLDQYIELQSLISIFALAKFYGNSDESARNIHLFFIFVVLIVIYVRPTIEVIVTASLTIPFYNLSSSYMILIIPTVMLINEFRKSYIKILFMFSYAYVPAIMYFLWAFRPDVTTKYPPMLGIVVWCLLAMLVAKQSRKAKVIPIC